MLRLREEPEKEWQGQVSLKGLFGIWVQTIADNSKNAKEKSTDNQGAC